MRIGIDASCLLKEITGVGTYTLNLIQALLQQGGEHDYIMWLNALKGKPELPVIDPPGSGTWHRTRIPGKVLLSWWRYFPWPSVERLIGPLDVFHSPNFFFQRIAHAKTVATIHDLFFLRRPDMCERYGGKYFAKVLPRRLNEVDAVIAVSDFTKSELIDLLKFPESRITVIHEAVDASFAALANRPDGEAIFARYNLRQPYFLALGTIEPRKNYHFLLTAYARAVHQYPELPKLVIIGRPGWGSENFTRDLHALRLEQRVSCLGYIPQDHVPLLVKRALLLLQPTLYEGFGLPVLEAMSLGTPVLAARIPALTEVGAEAISFFEPGNEEEFTHRLISLVDDDAVLEEFRVRGKARSKEFSWSKAAGMTLQLYASLVGARCS